MKRVLVLIATVAAALAAVVPLASADYNRVRDEPDNWAESGEHDILWGTHEHTVSGRLKHAVRAADSLSRRDPFYLDISTRGSACPEYIAGRFGDEKGVFSTRCEDGAGGEFARPVEKVGALDIEQPADEHRLRFLFRPRAIGKPAEYLWRFVVRDPSSGFIRDSMAPHRHVLSKGSG